MGLGSTGLLDVGLSLLLALLVQVHHLLAPYTKVEESFNIQAIHDIVIHGFPTHDLSRFFQANYDHFTFPGPVPRTFVGAAALSVLLSPIKWAFTVDPWMYQLLARGLLGLINTIAIIYFRQAVDTAFGKAAGRWYILLQASQFHVMFYASRTLPNMFAFAFTTLALRSIILSQAIPSKTKSSANRRMLALFLLTVAGVIFRSEIAILLATQTAHLLIRGRTSLLSEVIPAGLFGAVIALATTTSIDSYFWQRFPLWPELVGFHYNTILGKSSDWGTSPWYHYLIAIPRLLMNPLTWSLCIPTAFVSRATRRSSTDILLPLLAFVALYSFLPHKEWRFIIYVIPGITAVAAAGASWIWTRRSKNTVYAFLSLALILSVLASFAASMVLLYISSLNYPGGAAISRLHDLAASNGGPGVVHMDNLACQTGVTRFLERDLGEGWGYDKTEDSATLLNPAFWERFDYAIAESPERVIGSWVVVEAVRGYVGVGVRKLDDGEDAAPLMPRGLGNVNVNAVLEVYHRVALGIRQRLTKGWWPTFVTEPKLYILKKEKT